MTEVEPYQDQTGTKMNMNRYATKKTIAQGMLDIALLTANASQLKYVLQTNGKHPFYTLMISLISASLILQVTTGISILYIGTLNINKERDRRRADLLNNFITAQIFVVSVVNIIISSFGIEQVNLHEAKVKAAQLKESEASRLILLPPSSATNLTSSSGQMIFNDGRL